MQILTAEQLRQWDEYTISHEPVTSIDLMERAAKRCVEWILDQPWNKKHFIIFCGKGNNGGDGLAIARMLLESENSVSIYILEHGRMGSNDFQNNLQRLHETNISEIYFIQKPEHFPEISTEDVIIDALFGSGLNKPLDDLAAELVRYINQHKATVVAIDFPGGLFSDASSKGLTVMEADYTLSFQCYKQALLMQENASFIGQVRILDIGLQQEFLNTIDVTKEFVDEIFIRRIYKPRNRFSHKGVFGHALIMAGSYGKMGAAVLTSKACVGAGAGLTTAYIPKCGYSIMQTAVPEAMVITGEDEHYISALPDDPDRFSSIGVGPGIGTNEHTQKLFSFIVRRFQKPLVIDADGLNCLAQQKKLLTMLPPHSILTPHPKEFTRLFGHQENDFARIEIAGQKARELQLIIVLKSHYTVTALPDGRLFYNSTGNAGMAKGGSGDVLTGIITALLAQGYPPHEAAIAGVYLHGWAGDIAAKKYSQEALTASQIIECLGKVFLKFIT